MYDTPFKQQISQVVVGLGVVRKAAQRLAKLTLRRGQITAHSGDGAQKVVRLRPLRIRLLRALQHRGRLLHFAGTQIRVAQVVQQQVVLRKLRHSTLQRARSLSILVRRKQRMRQFHNRRFEVTAFSSASRDQRIASVSFPSLSYS